MFDCFGFKKYKGDKSTFLVIWRIQYQIYPQTCMGQKYGAFYSNNKVRVHTLSLVLWLLLVQLSWRVTLPYLFFKYFYLYEQVEINIEIYIFLWFQHCGEPMRKSISLLLTQCCHHSLCKISPEVLVSIIPWGSRESYLNRNWLI